MTIRIRFFRPLLLTSICGSLVAAQAAPPLVLQGTVTDSIRHVPLVGATVIASETSNGVGPVPDRTATTDARGRYIINPAGPGMYLVTVQHPWLDSTGLGVPARTVAVRDQPVTVNLAVPSGATIRAAFCPISAHDSTLGLVAGYVKDVSSEHPVAGARVVFAWDDSTSTASQRTPPSIVGWPR